MSHCALWVGVRALQRLKAQPQGGACVGARVRPVRCPPPVRVLDLDDRSLHVGPVTKYKQHFRQRYINTYYML